MTSTPATAGGVVSRPARDPGIWREAFGHLLGDPSALIGLVIVVALVAIAILAPVIAPHSPELQYREGLTPDGQPLAPRSMFPLGTDELGRDELSRLIYGARVSLIVGILGNLLA